MPVSAETTIEANSPEEAVKMALAMFDRNKRSLIDLKSADEAAAVDWQPNAEPA